MADGNQPNPPEQVEDKETPETLAAIRRGVADAEAGRVTSLEDVRTKLLQWNTELSSQNKR